MLYAASFAASPSSVKQVDYQKLFPRTHRKSFTFISNSEVTIAAQHDLVLRADE